MSIVDRRLPLLTPDELDPAQRQVYDAVLSSRRAGGSGPLTDADGRLLGPFNAMLYDPPVGAAMEAMGAALRFAGSLPDLERELAVLVVAERTGCAFERWAHEPLARAAGLDEDALAAVAEGRWAALPDDLRAVAQATAALTDEGALDDTTHAHVRSSYGERGLVELIALAGYYRLLACLMDAFAVGLPDGVDVGPPPQENGIGRIDDVRSRGPAGDGTESTDG